MLQLPVNFKVPVCSLGVVGLCQDERRKGCSSYLVSERPWEQSIVVSFHDNKEQGHVGSFSCPIPIQINPQTDLVAILRSVES